MSVFRAAPLVSLGDIAGRLTWLLDQLADGAMCDLEIGLVDLRDDVVAAIEASTGGTAKESCS